MVKKQSNSKQTDDLRKRAEGRVTKSTDDIEKMSTDEVKKLVQELKVHQIELEMQNDALRNAHSEIEEAHRRYADLFNFAPIGYFTLDGKNSITEANVTGASLLGRHRRQIAKQPFKRFILPAHYGTFDAHLKAALESQEKQTCRLKMTATDGRYFDALIETIAVMNDEGQFDHYRCSVIDITEITKVQEELIKRTKQLESAYTEMESFSYSISHDLRAPLRAIDGFALMLLKKHGAEFDEDSLRKFNVIRSSADMMGRLIDDILSLSRTGRKQMSVEELDMNVIIRDVWSDLHSDREDRNISLTMKTMPSAYGDKTLIKQVYSNLLGNAVKFTKFRDPALVEVGGYIDKNQNVYYVKDNGAGFDIAYHDKLFGIFQRLHKPDEFEGTGIGLAIIKRIIERHGGRVWAEGKLNEGATFYFSLPLPHTHTHTHTHTRMTRLFTCRPLNDPSHIRITTKKLFFPSAHFRPYEGASAASN